MMDVEAPACRPRRPGFTLLELLVAIGIIGVLLAILIPVLARAHAAQRSASCLMTLRQIGDAFKLYAQDNRTMLPDPASTQLSWEQLLSPYFSSQYKCPSDQELFPSIQSSYDWRDLPDPSSTLSGISVLSIRRTDLVLAFEALSGWHRKNMINVVTFDGAASAMDDQACLADLDKPR